MPSRHHLSFSLLLLWSVYTSPLRLDSYMTSTARYALRVVKLPQELESVADHVIDGTQTERIQRFFICVRTFTRVSHERIQMLSDDRYEANDHLRRKSRQLFTYESAMPAHAPRIPSSCRSMLRSQPCATSECRQDILKTLASSPECYPRESVT